MFFLYVPPPRRAGDLKKKNIKKKSNNASVDSVGATDVGYMLD